MRVMNFVSNLRWGNPEEIREADGTLSAKILNVIYDMI